MAQTPKTLLLLGASRGLGLGLAEQFLERGWSVIATTRGAAPGLDALGSRYPDALRVETLDINDLAQAKALRASLDSRLNIIFVNAGVMDDKRAIGEVATEEFTRLLVTNALSPMRMIELFASLLASDGVVGAMSSGLGSIEGNTSGGYDVYRASKAALNMMLRSYAARNARRPVVAISPGWVRTDMGGADAALDVETSVRGVTEVLLSRVGQPGAAFLTYHGKPVPW